MIYPHSDGRWKRCGGQDVLDIYALMEQRLKDAGLYQYDWAAMRNAFQVMRYAMHEWAVGKDDKRVLNALMYGGDNPRDESKEVEMFFIDEILRYADTEDEKRDLEELLGGDEES